MDFFFLLYLNNELGRSWSLLGLKQCAKSSLHVMPGITKWAGYRHRIDPLRSSISGQNKSLNMTFHLKKKITEKEQILTENYFDRSKSRNGYISDSIYFLNSCFIKRSSCFMIFWRSDSGDTRFQRLTTILLYSKLWASSIDIAVR